MQTYTFRAVSWDDEVGAALDDALGQIEAKARAAGAVVGLTEPPGHPHPAGTAAAEDLVRHHVPRQRHGHRERAMSAIHHRGRRGM